MSQIWITGKESACMHLKWILRGTGNDDPLLDSSTDICFAV